jgi:hypothetical protein
MGPQCTDNLVRGLGELSQPMTYPWRATFNRGVVSLCLIALSHPFASPYASAALITVAVGSALVGAWLMRNFYAVAATVHSGTGPGTVPNIRPFAGFEADPLRARIGGPSPKVVVDPSTLDGDAWCPQSPGGSGCRDDG